MEGTTFYYKMFFNDEKLGKFTILVGSDRNGDNVFFPEEKTLELEEFCKSLYFSTLLLNNSVGDHHCFGMTPYEYDPPRWEGSFDGVSTL